MSTYGGVGDNLQHSWIPIIFSQMGYDVYVSNRIPYRNPEIKELVWDLNPYIKGYSDEEPNCGDIPTIIYKHKGLGFLENWQVAHGLVPEIRYPLVYYPPKKVKEVKGKILIDLTAQSSNGIYDHEKLREYIRNAYPREDVVIAVFKEGISFPVIFLDGYDLIFVENIFHYCDMIHSCKKFVSLLSGANVLASALKQYGEIDAESICCEHSLMRIAEAHNHYFFDNIKYIWI